MNAPEIDVRHVAKLARLAIDESEITRYQQELSAILGYVADLAELPTADVLALAQITVDGTAGREDACSPGLSRATFLAGAPASQLGMVRVPRILAES